MAKFRCNACGGAYGSVQADGRPYYHACPPLTLVRVIRAGADQLIPLTDLKLADTVTVTRGTATLTTLVSAMQLGDARDGDQYIERADARDENLVVVGRDERNQPITVAMKDGPGRTPIA